MPTEVPVPPFESRVDPTRLAGRGGAARARPRRRPPTCSKACSAAAGRAATRSDVVLDWPAGGRIRLTRPADGTSRGRVARQPARSPRPPGLRARRPCGGARRRSPPATAPYVVPARGQPRRAAGASALGPDRLTAGVSDGSSGMLRPTHRPSGGPVHVGAAEDHQRRRPRRRAAPTSGRPGCPRSSATAGPQVERRGIGGMTPHRRRHRTSRPSTDDGPPGRLLGLRGPRLHPQAPRRRRRLRPRRDDDDADHLRRDAPGLLRPEGPPRGHGR